jgi:single-strand DNA-binding protein
MSYYSNQCSFYGRIATDLELKYTPSGKACSSFRMAVENPFQMGEDGKPTAQFFSFVAWGKDAETLCQYAVKGQQLGVLTRAQNREYTDGNGQKVRITEFVVDNFKFGSKPAGSE